MYAECFSGWAIQLLGALIMGESRRPGGAPGSQPPIGHRARRFPRARARRPTLLDPIWKFPTRRGLLLPSGAPVPLHDDRGGDLASGRRCGRSVEAHRRCALPPLDREDVSAAAAELPTYGDGFSGLTDGKRDVDAGRLLDLNDDVLAVDALESGQFDRKTVVPGLRFTKEYNPVSPDFWTCFSEVPVLISVTVAPGSTAPAVSTTYRSVRRRSLCSEYERARQEEKYAEKAAQDNPAWLCDSHFDIVLRNFLLLWSHAREPTPTQRFTDRGDLYQMRQKNS